jgi:anthranilate synthase component 1
MNAALPIFPDFASFSRSYDAGKKQLVWCRQIADTDTPVSAMLKLGADRPFNFLFESVEGGTTRGRYSFITMEPELIWRCRRGVAEINHDPAGTPDAFVTQTAAPFDSLRSLIAESRLDLPEGAPPMATGLFGYLGYDMVRLMEPTVPDSKPDVLQVPDAILVRPRVVAVFDRLEDVVTLFSVVRPKPGVSAEAAYEATRVHLTGVAATLAGPLPEETRFDGPLPESLPAPVSDCGPEAYMDMVRRCVEYIKAGDAFQIVPSQRFSIPFPLPPFALYRSLRRLNPSPFLIHLNFGDFAIVGSSPEILVRLRGGTVTIRPLAGTRPRGATVEEDKALERDLLADPKELAEHLMLLDLGRNDVGRVAQIGSVKVPAQFAVERYRYVMHISSTVEGKIKPDEDALSALAAGFPAGTLSGAPKVRAMQIIDEVETSRRGVYAGAVGYFGANGDLDTCIALRTALVKDGTLYAQAGAGVVADSVPETEEEETRAKARALFRAADEALKLARAPYEGNLA